jgi:cyclophilin family peptidyl-prolyl cis-trans isomerase
LQYLAAVPNPRTQRERQRQRQAERERQRARELKRAQRKRAAIGIACVAVIAAVVAGVIVAGTRDPSQITAGATTTSVDPLADLRSTTSSALPTGPPASLPTVAPGASVPGTAPCPNLDGSSPRSTSFTAPIPNCIDPNLTYDATITTSAGVLKFLLNPKEGAQTVNSFVFLAGYHYWDGAPLTTIAPNITFVVQNPVPGGPGYTIPNETPPQGTIFPVGRLAMVAAGNGPLDPGTFQVALGEEAAGLPQNTPSFGIMLDGLETLQAIRKAGSQTGAPTGVVTIQSIAITPSPAS